MANDNLLLQQLQGVLAFIVYRLIPQNDGSLDKVPYNPYTGKNCDPHDPNEWMLPDAAALWAEQLGYGFGVGVVISEQIVLPNGMRLFCVDLDKCRDGNQWLPHAASFCTRFAGALTEASVSTNGLHIFGCYRGERPEHGVKNKTYRMELYTRLRFIAVTGYGAHGNALIDATDSLHKFATQFFPPHDDTDYGDELSIAPVAEWSGPTDDGELIARALRSTSARAIFGGKAAFADLWFANSEVLAKVFPAYKYTAWDESAADQALANHLAFWTGKHGARMEKLMRDSKLVREKWDNRAGYLLDTINKACGSQVEVYKDRTLEVYGDPSLAPVVDISSAAVPSTAANTSAVPTPPIAVASVGGFPPPALVVAPTLSARPQVGDYLTLQQQLHLFDGCVYVQDMHQIMMPQGYTLTSERFDAEFSGYTFAVEADGQHPAKHAWECFVHSKIFQFPKVKGTYFEPRVAPRTVMLRDGWTFINSWVPVEIPRRQGDVTPFLQHMKRILPRGYDAEILLAYFAACVQYPGVKFQWWPFIQGVEGNGKTMLSELLQAAVGRRLTHWPKAGEIGSKFNAAFYGKLLVLVEDIKISEDRHSLWETLKPMITGRQLEIEYKGVDKVMREVCFNGVLNSNHKDGIRKTRNDRRLCTLFCAQQHESDLERDGLTEDYFNWFRAWVAANGDVVADYLLTYQIPDEWNPATRAIRPPKTTATEEAIMAGLGAAEQEVLEAIEQNTVGFRNGWVSSSALDRLLALIGKTGSIPRNKRRSLLESLGYSPHPALLEGRSSVADADGTRPRLYVRKEAQGASETDPRTVMQWYQYCQK